MLRATENGRTSDAHGGGEPTWARIQHICGDRLARPMWRTAKLALVLIPLGLTLWLLRGPGTDPGVLATKASADPAPRKTKPRSVREPIHDQPKRQVVARPPSVRLG